MNAKYVKRDASGRQEREPQIDLLIFHKKTMANWIITVQDRYLKPLQIS